MQVNGILLARVIMQKSHEDLKQLAFKGPFVAWPLQSALQPLRQLLVLLEELVFCIHIANIKTQF